MQNMPPTELVDTIRKLYKTYTAQQIGDAIRQVRLELELYTLEPEPVKKTRTRRTQE